MPRYSITVSATSNSSGATEDSFIELTAAASSALHIQKFSITMESANSDDVVSWRLVRKSAAGATGTSFTPVKKDSAMRSAAATCQIKNGTNAFSIGTVTDVCDLGSFNGRGGMEWTPRKRDEDWVASGAGIIGLVVSCSAASKVIRANMEFED